MPKCASYHSHPFILGFQPPIDQVTQLFDELIRQFAQGAFEGPGAQWCPEKGPKQKGRLKILCRGNDQNLQQDEGVVMWWATASVSPVYMDLL